MGQRALRFCVGDPTGLRSSEWIVVWKTNKPDVFVMTRTIGAVFKASIHERGRCHVKAPDPRAPGGSGIAARYLEKWSISTDGLYAYPFGIIVPTSELRHAEWPPSHRRTTWVSPASSATVIGVILSRRDVTPEQLRAARWTQVIGSDVLTDGRRLLIAVAHAEYPTAKRDELVAIRNTFHPSVGKLTNPRAILVAGDNGSGTRHFVEIAATANSV